MVKEHNVKLTINNQSGFDMSYLNDWFDSGRLADDFNWPTVIKDGDHQSILCYERDWALDGCSGFVQYKIENVTVTIGFSNPSIGTNKIGIGTDGKSVWKWMTSHDYKPFTVDIIIDSTTMKCHCQCTGTTTNMASVKIERFVPKSGSESYDNDVVICV